MYKSVETGCHLRLPAVSRFRRANNGADDDHLSIAPTISPDQAAADRQISAKDDRHP
jgi:hypothetical protein